MDWRNEADASERKREHQVMKPFSNHVSRVGLRFYSARWVLWGNASCESTDSQIRARAVRLRAGLGLNHRHFGAVCSRCAEIGGERATVADKIRSVPRRLRIQLMLVQ